MCSWWRQRTYSAAAFFLLSGSRKTGMFGNTAIRTALTITIAGYTTALTFVIATSIAGLETANSALDRMGSEETAALRHLNPPAAVQLATPNGSPRNSVCGRCKEVRDERSTGSPVHLCRFVRVQPFGRSRGMRCAQRSAGVGMARTSRPVSIPGRRTSSHRMSCTRAVTRPNFNRLPRMYATQLQPAAPHVTLAPGVRIVVVLSDSYRHGPGAVKSG